MWRAGHVSRQCTASYHRGGVNVPRRARMPTGDHFYYSELYHGRISPTVNLLQLLWINCTQDPVCCGCRASEKSGPKCQGIQKAGFFSQHPVAILHILYSLQHIIKQHMAQSCIVCSHKAPTEVKL